MTARTLPVPVGVTLLRSTLGAGSATEGTARIHTSPFTGGYDHVAFSRASLWEGSMTFGAVDFDSDNLMRAWVQEAVGNVLSVPLTSLDPGVNSLPAFPSILAAQRQPDGTASLTLATAPDAAWQHRLIHLAGRMARVVNIEAGIVNIFPAVLPDTFPASIESNGHFLFKVLDITGGQRKPWGINDITINFVEATGAAQPALLPDNVIYWMERALRWEGLPVVWDTDDANLVEFDGKLLDFETRLIEW